MKRRIIIIGGIILLVLLTIRMIVTSINRQNEDKKVFAQQLDYDFSAEIDSVHVFNRNHGMGIITFHPTRGEVSARTERKAKKKLKRNKDIAFLIQRKNGKLAIMSDKADLYHKGDSITVKGADDNISIFREGKSVASEKISSCVRDQGN